MPLSSTTDLRQRSVEVVRAGQTASGAYVACPTFPVYGFAWLRDGAFVADAMSRAGEIVSAEAFFDWAAEVARARYGRDLAARYRLDGGDDESEWPQEQWDGWGLWLWAVAAHCDRHDVSRARWAEAAVLVASFLDDAWHRPCADWWEERVGLHAATLGSVVAGLDAWQRPAAEPRAALDREADWRLDASLLALAAPLGVVPADRIPLEEIERRLVSPGGGLHRHPDDTYYGGGEWLLLTAMLGLVHLDTGDGEAARACLDWIAAHATAGGELPEQSQDHLLAPERYEPWVEKWGPPASPLLWSHAMYLDLSIALDG